MDGGDHSHSFYAVSLIISDDLEAGFSGAGDAARFASYHTSRRRGSYRALVRSPSPKRSGGAAAGFFFDELYNEEPHHFLDACFLCKKHLARNSDIFMYRGDTPFCSEECRQKQIDMDEVKEMRMKWKDTASMNQQMKEQHPNSEKIHVRAAGSIVAG